MGGVKHEIEYTPGEGHEHDLTHETDDDRHHEPVFEVIVPPFAFFQISDERQEEENSRDEFLGPVKYELGIVGPGKRREGKEDETRKSRGGNQPVNRVFADPARLSKGLLPPPGQIAQIQKDGEKEP